MPPLVPNPGRVLRRAWSMRFIGASIVLSGVELALPYLDGILPVPRGTFALLTLATSIGAGVARLLAQRGVDEVQS